MKKKIAGGRRRVDNPIPNRFFKNINNLRKKQGLSQSALAVELSLYMGCEITRPAIGAWEENRCLPHLYVFAQIAKYFKVSLDELYN